MRRIYGKVLVKESNVGVPDLVVAAYDSERELQEIIAGQMAVPPPPVPPITLQRPPGDLPRYLTELPPQSQPDVLVPPSPPAAQNSTDPLDLGISSDFFKQLGKRIGSVLTDQNGSFTFDLDELHFQGNEERPDLVIVVFAPEDVHQMTRPYPWPPEKRILYMSTVPRKDSGAEETYIIRLIQDQLTFFSIPLTHTSSTTPPQVDAAVQLAPIVQNQYNLLFIEAKAKTQSLSAIPIHLRNTAYDTYMVAPRTSFSTGVSDLAKKQTSAISDVLDKKLTFYKPIVQGPLDALYFGGGGLTYKELIDFIFTKTGGLDLVKPNFMQGQPSPNDILSNFGIAIKLDGQ